MIGYPKCDLLVSMDVLIAGVTAAKFPVPNDKSLIGYEVYLQAASLGPLDVLGVSNRTDVKFGAR